MNKRISLDEFLSNTDFFISEAKEGKIFVYPTDTIYGIGAIYTPENVEKVFTIKKRDKKKQFSIIAPDFERIKNNYELREAKTNKLREANNNIITIDLLKSYLDRYHGVTYIFDYDRPGVRIIKHPFQDFVEKLGDAFITTSCNLTGDTPIQDLKDLPGDIADEVDYIIDGGVLSGRPSVLIDFISDKIIER